MARMVMNEVEQGSKIRLCVGLQFYSIMIYYNSTDYDWGVEIINLTVIGNLKGFIHKVMQTNSGVMLARQIFCV